MANISSQLTSYRDASTTYTVTPYVPQKRAIADYIDIIDPWEAPLLRRLGISDQGSGGMDKARQFRILNWPSSRIEWLEDGLLGHTTTLGASVAASNATATLAITVGTANMLRVGMVLMVDAENLLVRAVSSDSATVTRMFGGTATNVNTSASHAASATIQIIGYARGEGADSDASVFTQVAAPYNYTQIFQDEIKVSRTQGKLTQYGIADEYDYQVEKKFKEQLILLEKALLWNTVRNAGDSSTTNPRTMGGLPVFVTTNTATMSNGPLTQVALENQVQAAWSLGGMPDLIVCGPWVKRKITSFYTNAIRTERSERMGGAVIDIVQTEFGDLEVIKSRHIKPTELYILSTEYVGVIPFDPFFDEPLAKDGDYDKGQIVGEYTAVVKNAEAHARITAISTTS